MKTSKQVSLEIKKNARQRIATITNQLAADLLNASRHWKSDEWIVLKMSAALEGIKQEYARMREAEHYASIGAIRKDETIGKLAADYFKTKNTRRKK